MYREQSISLFKKDVPYLDILNKYKKWKKLYVVILSGTSRKESLSDNIETTME